MPKTVNSTALTEAQKAANNPIYLLELALTGSTLRLAGTNADVVFPSSGGSTYTGWGFQFGENGQNQLASSNLMQWQGGKLLTVFPESVATAKPIAAK